MECWGRSWLLGSKLGWLLFRFFCSWGGNLGFFRFGGSWLFGYLVLGYLVGQRLSKSKPVLGSGCSDFDIFLTSGFVQQRK